jgi:NTE family protein
MIGLALEGGGVRGSYQIGAYMALKKCGIKFDGIVGTSIGSFNAAMIVAGKEKSLMRFWQSADIGKILGLSSKYVNTINNSDNIVEKIYEGSKEIIRNFLHRGIPIQGLRDVLNRYLTENAVRRSKQDYGLATVMVKGFKPLYLFKEDIPKGDLFDYIIASCYLPLFKMEKMRDGNYYLDGGFYDKSPSNMLESKGYDKIYVIALNSIGLTQKRLGKAEIITISPSKNLGLLLNVNRKQIKYNIKLGFYDTIKKLKKLDGYKYIFKVKNDKYYHHIINKLPKKDLHHLQTMLLAKDDKELVLRFIEYIFKKEKKEYNKIYNPGWELFKIKLKYKQDNIYQIIRNYRRNYGKSI